MTTTYNSRTLLNKYRRMLEEAFDDVPEQDDVVSEIARKIYDRYPSSVDESRVEAIINLYLHQHKLQIVPVNGLVDDQGNV